MNGLTKFVEAGRAAVTDAKQRPGFPARPSGGTRRGESRFSSDRVARQTQNSMTHCARVACCDSLAIQVARQGKLTPVVAKSRLKSDCHNLPILLKSGS